MTSIHQPVSTDPPLRDCTYNLFRNKEHPNLVCAVPEECPVPRFIEAEGWSFARALRPQDAPLAGFHDKAAHAGVRYNGYYLFQITDREHQTEASTDSTVAA